MLGIERSIQRRGGLARTRELVADGYPDSVIRVFGAYGSITHVSFGWWGLRTVSPEVVRARRAGGRLACVSALEFYGAGRGDGRLHISIGRGGSRPRDDTVIVHWTRRELGGDRQAVSIEVAIEQMRLCQWAAEGDVQRRAAGNL